MATLWVNGTEQTTWDLTTSGGQQLHVNGAAQTYTLLSDAVVGIRVQLGNAAAGLAGGERVEVDVKVTNIYTGDECLLPQIVMEVPAGVTMVQLNCEPFVGKAGDIIKVFAKSSDLADNSVGGIVNMLMLGVD